MLTLDRAMRRTVADLSGIAREFVIPERDNGPRPQATYATVFETELVRGGIDGTTEFTEAEGSTTTLDARSQLPVAASYRIEFYRDGARGAARACWQRMVTEAGETTARLNGVVFGDIGELRHMDDVVADEYEQREFLRGEGAVRQHLDGSGRFLRVDADCDKSGLRSGDLGGHLHVPGYVRGYETGTSGAGPAKALFVISRPLSTARNSL